MIRFHALRFDSIRRFHHLFQDEKKSGNFKRSFQTNERLLSRIARSKARIARSRARIAFFVRSKARIARSRPWIAGSHRNGNGQLFSGSGTRYFAILSKNKFEERGTCDPQKLERDRTFRIAIAILPIPVEQHELGVVKMSPSLV